MTKDEIRQQIAAQKKSFQGLELLTERIVSTFQTLETFQEAKTVGAYMPLPDEVDITPLFPSFAKASEGRQISGKKIYIPSFDEANGSYRLAEYTPELKKGKFGIPEPANPVFAPEELDLIIVPGVAFDRAGHRIGRGGGFYDQLLPQYHAVRVGVCFDFQCLEKVPSEPHDCNVDLLVTELQILEFATNC